MFNHFLDLKKAWENTPQARGGINAIKGFDFQFLLYLTRAQVR